VESFVFLLSDALISQAARAGVRFTTSDASTESAGAPRRAWCAADPMPCA
jgi:hypothetical protein